MPVPSCEFTTSRVPCSLRDFTDEPMFGHPVTQFVLRVHSAFARAWSNETAHPAYRSVPPHDAGKLPNPPSGLAYGQCVPTAAVAFECLRNQFPEETFSIESGFTYQRMRSQDSLLNIDSHVHVWLHWTPAISEPATLEDIEDIHVIDMSFGQLEDTPTVVRSAHRLVLEGLVYQSLRRFDNLDAFYRQFSQREPGVRNRVNRFREQLLSVIGVETKS